MNAPIPIPIPASECPLCGGPNACGPAASGSFDTPCWCTTMPIPPALVDSVPEDAQGKACVCRRCVEKANGTSTGA